MDKNQYQPPQSEHSAGIYKQVEQSPFKGSPERLGSPFQFVKDVEALVDSVHGTGEELEQKKGREVHLKYTPITFVRPARPHHEILNEQLNMDRSRTTDLFAEKGKFCVWYGGSAHSPRDNQKFGSWFIEEVVAGKPGAGRIIRIQTHPDYIQMFNHEGQPMNMTISDLEIFVSIVRNYVPAILPSYPFDQAWVDVVLEDIDMPENIGMLLSPQRTDDSKLSNNQAF